MKPEYAVFYASYYEVIKNLPKEEKVIIYDAIFEYCFNGIEQNLSGTLKIVWTLIKPQIDANIRNYKNGKKGGRPSIKKEEKKPPLKPPFKTPPKKGYENQEEEEEEKEEEYKKENKEKNFKKFWEEYPNKKSKQKAEKIFLNLSEKIQQECIESVKNQKEWRTKQPDNKFLPEWKHPTTWLNQGCWEDELEEPERTPKASDFFDTL